MTGGMLGLAGSTGVADAASDGGSRKISVDQMPAHSHNITHVWHWRGNPERLFDLRSLPNSNNRLDAVPDISTDLTGGGADYIPAHTSVYGWRRTA